MIRSKTKLLFISLLFLGLYLWRLNQIPEYQLPENKLVKVIGRISQQPYLKDSKQIIIVGPVLIKTSRFPGYFYGQKIEVIGKFQREVLSPFQTQFVAFYPTIRLAENEENLEKIIVFRQWLFQIRGQLEKRVNQLFLEPESSLLNGILLGAKKEMPQDFWQNLRETGTLHVVVASGYNISVLAGWLIVGLTWFLNRRWAILFTLLGIIAYVLMVGAEPPVVRAAIMAGVAFTAQVLGRRREALVSLLFTAGLMLLITPLVLFDLGFQLSFMATAGILLIEPLLKRGGLFQWPLFGDELATTLAAQIGVLPLLLFNFGQVSFLSPLINALVLPVVPLLMPLGTITLLVGLLIRPLGQLLAWLTSLLLKYFVVVIRVFSHLSWASFKISRLSPWWVVGYYLVLFLIVVNCQRKKIGC